MDWIACFVLRSISEGLQGDIEMYHKPESLQEEVVQIW